MSASILFHLGLAAYLVASAAYITWLLRPGAGVARAGSIALLIGFCFHGIAVGLRVITLVDLATFHFAEGLSFLALVVVGAYLLLDRVYRLPIIGAFVAPLVVVVLIPAHLLPLDGVPTGPIRGVLLPLHIGVSLGGVAMFALGFGVAVMYLLLEREVKAKRLGALFRRLPSLELLDRLNYRLVVIGFGMLSVAIATGAAFSQQIQGTPLSPGAKQTFALFAWGLTATVVFLRQTTGWRGRRVALATVAGFVLMFFAYLGVFAGRVP